MMAQDLGETGSAKQLFACGHENPAGNRYCNVCGEVRGDRCPVCSSLNRGHAKFCGTCGARFSDEQTAPETTVESPTPQRSLDRGTPVTPHPTAASEKEWARELGPDNPLLDREEPPWAGRGSWRRDAFLASPIDDMTVEDEDELEAKDRRRKVFLLAGVAVTLAVTIAIVLGVARFSPTRHGGFFERARGGVAADRDSASAARGAQPPAPEGTDASAASSARESKAAARESKTAPRESKTAAAPHAATSESAQGATRPAAPRPPELPATSPSLPSRSTSQGPAATGDEAPSRAARALAPASQSSEAQSSEERMADFLIEQLGPEPAAQKALSTAAWYDAGQSEHAFWERVAAAIKRRAGS